MTDETTNPKPDLTLTPWSDEDLDALSQVTPERQQEAAAWWRKNAPRRFKRLLDAEDRSD